MRGTFLSEKYFRAGNDLISIFSDCPLWADSFCAYLSMPRSEPGGALPSIELILHEAPEKMLDKIMPLPPAQHIKSEKTLLVDRDVPYRTFSKDGLKWKDFLGFGRITADLSVGRAEAVKVKDSGISGVYADIVLGYNPLLYLLSRFGWMTVHASCVKVNGKGVLFTGVSGSGKSTAAYAMLRGGHRLLADDRILVRPEGGSFSALSISDVIKLDADAMSEFFPKLLSLPALHRAGKEIYRKTSLLPGNNYINSARLKYLVVLERTGSATSAAEKINPSRVIGSLFPVTLGDFEPEDMLKKFNFLMNMLEKLECYKVFFGTDMDKFSRVIDKITS